MSHVHADPLPKGALMLAIGLALTALTATTLARLLALPPAAQPAAIRAAEHARPIGSRTLRFLDRADGAVVIADTATGRTAATIEPGTNSGFIRGVLRGFARDRRLRGLGDAAPFALAAWSNGQLTLTDSATGRAVELGAFGDTNRAAFAALLNRKPS